MTPGAATSTCRAASVSASASRRLELAVFLAVLLGVLAAAGCHQGRAVPTHAESPGGTWHVIAPGETLEAIAKRADVPMADLLEINGLADAVDARPGRLIFILGSPGQQAPPVEGAAASPPALAAVAEVGPT